MRVLVVGWFSFVDGEATAGDLLALDAVLGVLRDVPHDIAWSPHFRPGFSLDDARPHLYSELVFVCGPLHGPLIEELHRTYAHCRRTAIGVSVIDPNAPAVCGFDRVIARDGDGPPTADLAIAADELDSVPIAGVLLTGAQGEYGANRRHESVIENVHHWLADLSDCALLPVESRLDRTDWRLCSSPAGFISVLRRLDVLVTNRLHGLVLGLQNAVPVLAIDPVAGGGKVTAQAEVWAWPCLRADEVDPQRLGRLWDWCLSDTGRHAAGLRATTPRRTALAKLGMGSP
jgi:hypothetical protein